MSEVKKILLQNGARKVEFIKAQKSIEDWFLIDYPGIIKYLRLPSRTPKEAGTGLTVLKKLFIKAHRIYSKGGKADGLIEHLDITKIKTHICPSLRTLCKCIGLKCDQICNK